MTAILALFTCSALILYIVKSIAPGYFTLGGVFVAMIAGSIFVKEFARIISELAFLREYGLSEYLSVILEVTGICVLADICSDVCRETGSETLSKTVILYAKAEIILLVIPYAKRVLSLLSSFF